jgi:hypothetical protein
LDSHAVGGSGLRQAGANAPSAAFSIILRRAAQARWEDSRARLQV